MRPPTDHPGARVDLPTDDSPTYLRYVNTQYDWRNHFRRRPAKLIAGGRKSWWPRHRFHWLLHNCIVHPVIGLFPFKWAMRLHDWSSKRLAGSHVMDDLDRHRNALRRKHNVMGGGSTDHEPVM